MLSRLSFRTALAKPMCQARYLNIHEFQAKGLLKEAGCKVEFGIMCQSTEEVIAALAKVKSEKKVVKSQILAGGRGMGTFKDGFKGGVHVCKNADDALAAAKKMLGNTLITKQTGPSGQVVSKLFVTEAIPNIKRELYVALVLDRKTCSPTFIGSAEGGMGIEELAHSNPEKIKKMIVNIHDGIDHDACVKFAQELGFADGIAETAAEQFKAIYNLAKSNDCTMVEVNPLVELEDQTVMCIDAKLSFDDNAQFRRPEIFAMADTTQMDAKEVMAAKHDLNYIALDGNVGCLVNGAGLAMATMDIISLYGQKPANFLDVGGSAKASQIVAAFKIVTHDPNVKCILVNIFGGIMKCDIIAEGVVEGAKHLAKEGIDVPLVVRLEGTNEELGKKILRDSGLKIETADNLDEAGKKACAIVAARK
ncbi:succinyl-CoA ligase, putative [Bodo saltans]|uniref:Succinate--CoA ligase [ADP-forming] subunit beta, mitochondrial n=1 Tax=Bodo saltans TaxID=75058 RepID=A0A0S4J4K0_BODSA|nr:succinyl-CoA ligase, putative [Bodo saltans]|eukprot:CUG77929.1 succinyl-CoA ligase, putative [Bodo saltans]